MIQLWYLVEWRGGFRILDSLYGPPPLKLPMTMQEEAFESEYLK